MQAEQRNKPELDFFDSNMMRGDQYAGPLAVGQKVYCGLYGGKYGIISAIEGQQRPESIKRLAGGAVVMGGGAFFDVIFDTGRKSRMLPESILRGVQWRISEQIVDSGVIAAGERLVRETDARIKEEKRREAEERERERESLPGQFPYLTTKENAGKMSDHALAAKNIKEELRRTFPGVPFSVRYNGRGGASVKITWTDGPTREDVVKVTGKYQEGHFDGMEDIYRYSHSVFNGVFGGAKWVNEERTASTAHIMTVAAGMGHTLTEANFDQWGNVTGPDWDTVQAIMRRARETPGPMPSAPEELVSFPAGGVTVTENAEKGGLEIRFSEKPSPAILENLKAHGWRWSRFNGCWYNKHTAENAEFARNLSAN